MYDYALHSFIDNTYMLGPSSVHQTDISATFTVTTPITLLQINNMASNEFLTIKWIVMVKFNKFLGLKFVRKCLIVTHD